MWGLRYPVFPWVLVDYTSEHLDLSNPAVFRDLSKPIGALNPARLQMYLDRYRGMEEDERMPKFLYGTHYSSAGTTLFYLVRMEPFATEAIRMQDGKFDHADRMFDSIPSCWLGCYNNAADVKELIPEFFYLAEFLRNSNGYNMGVKQSTLQPIDDVVLPAWASSPEDFVRQHRAALESEYVSSNLHRWIDLIFGVQQQGQASVEAHNVFFHLTYEDKVDLDALEDPGLRDATIAQIEHFGQTPSQLLDAPHPRRFAAEDAVPSVFLRLFDLQLYVQHKVTTRASIDNPLLFIHPCADKILTLGLDRVLGVHRWRNSTPEYVPPFSFDIEKPAVSSTRKIGVHFAVRAEMGTSAAGRLTRRLAGRTAEAHWRNTEWRVCVHVCVGGRAGRVDDPADLLCGGRGGPPADELRPLGQQLQSQPHRKRPHHPERLAAQRCVPRASVRRPCRTWASQTW